MGNIFSVDPVPRGRGVEVASRRPRTVSAELEFQAHIRIHIPICVYTHNLAACAIARRLQPQLFGCDYKIASPFYARVLPHLPLACGRLYELHRKKTFTQPLHRDYLVAHSGRKFGRRVYALYLFTANDKSHSLYENSNRKLEISLLNAARHTRRAIQQASRCCDCRMAELKPYQPVTVFECAPTYLPTC